MDRAVNITIWELLGLWFACAVADVIVTLGQAVLGTTVWTPDWLFGCTVALGGTMLYGRLVRHDRG